MAVKSVNRIKSLWNYVTYRRMQLDNVDLRITSLSCDVDAAVGESVSGFIIVLSACWVVRVWALNSACDNWKNLW